MFIERSDAAKRSCCASACRYRQAIVIRQNSMSMLIRFGQNWWAMALPMMPATILVVGAMARGNMDTPAGCERKTPKADWPSAFWVALRQENNMATNSYSAAPWALSASSGGGEFSVQILGDRPARSFKHDRTDGGANDLANKRNELR
jgi:hypothetical protein